MHPGFIDPHVHVVHGTCRGIFGDALGESPRTVNFADWKADVRPREEHAAAVFAGLEMLHNGFTCFIEPGTVFDCDAVAAATEQVRGDIIRQLHLHEPEVFLASFNRPNLNYTIVPKAKAAKAAKPVKAAKPKKGKATRRKRAAKEKPVEKAPSGETATAAASS